jgi:hypothetical protein
MSKKKSKEVRVAGSASGFVATLDSVKIARLMKIEKAILKSRDKVVTAAAKGYLEIGALLVEARNEFQGDAEFGQWRAERLPGITMHQASAMIAAASVTQEAPELAEICGLSVLQEIAYGGPALIEWAKERAANPEPITVKEVRDERHPEGWGGGGLNVEVPGNPIRQLEGEVLPPTSEHIKRPPAGAVTSHILRQEKECLELEVPDRYAFIQKNFSGMSMAKKGYLIMGLDPDPSSPTAYDTMDMIVTWVKDPEINRLNEDDIDTIDVWIEATLKDQKNF